eukprot:TRINITY_DN6868_c0_g3_i1.p4 TRINITY_DN6868_c0_g3~~TRINITY_DN6868_c0_g3_i1.p4  ORF type:complete len:146 (-),score=22.82 TRINITY_DN6868_c0_g3_i1:37-474(-)
MAVDELSELPADVGHLGAPGGVLGDHGVHQTSERLRAIRTADWDEAVHSLYGRPQASVPVLASPSRILLLVVDPRPADAGPELPEDEPERVDVGLGGRRHVLDRVAWQVRQRAFLYRHVLVAALHVRCDAEFSELCHEATHVIRI